MMNRSPRRSPLTLKSLKSPFASLREEQVKVSPHHRRVKAPAERPKGDSSPKNRKNGKRTLLPRREQFSRIDSIQSFNALASVSETQQPEDAHVLTPVKPRKTLERFLKQSRRSVRQGSPDISGPSSMSTVTIRKDKNGLPLLPFSDTGGILKNENVVFTKDLSFSKKRSSRTQAVFAQLRFEDGEAKVEYVRVPLMVPSSAPFTEDTKKTKKSSTMVTQLHGSSAATRSFHSLEDLDVEFVRVPLMSSAA
eukprot:CAMPEP_0119011608 /NCGR_PEP_ID=MMETSP1176-20130426/5784_1 /TAXON_ID=265551 /ORGANISM="Synedropsis recta cf, Strain CCMP1620" /LENGTH=250 /DNA_ID=CAMNT_0006964463 /DNA_START=84 /DNA_END=836 /DNA_ORIENTATION=-